MQPVNLQIRCFLQECPQAQHQVGIGNQNFNTIFNNIVAISDENNHNNAQTIIAVALSAISSIKNTNNQTANLCVPLLKNRIVTQLNHPGSREALHTLLTNPDIIGDNNLDNLRLELRERFKLGWWNGKINYGNNLGKCFKGFRTLAIKAPLMTFHKMFPNPMTTNTAMLGALLLTKNHVISRTVASDSEENKQLIKNSEWWAFYTSVSVLVKNTAVIYVEECRKDF